MGTTIKKGDEMKADELMVGDWVMPLKKKLKGIPGKVITIDGGMGVCWIDSKDYSCLVPCSGVERIPLTPEILEKNGFGYFSIGGAENWYIKDDYYNLHICEWSDSIWVLRYDSTEMNIPCTKVTFSYIHELQHALRLCGIEKEIIL